MDETTRRPSVSILATGTEIIIGDILNTNAQRISQLLTEHGIQVRTHRSVTDSDEDICLAILDLMKESDAIIVTGGLGPTSDDRTRFSLARAIQKNLVFDQKSWEALSNRLNRLGIHVHEANRQQALFPEGAIIFPNPNGTAAGCRVEHQGKNVYLLPGPPNESIPMFKDHVLPSLKALGFGTKTAYYRWLLMGISESQVGHEIDLIANRFSIETGYRFTYPFIEVKIRIPEALTADQAQEVQTLIHSHLSPYLISCGESSCKTATQSLCDYLVIHPTTIHVEDRATEGVLASLIIGPKTRPMFHWGRSRELLSTNELELIVSGLNEFWDSSETHKTSTVQVILRRNNYETVISSKPVAIRGNEVRYYAAEFAAHQTLRFLKSALTPE